MRFPVRTGIANIALNDAMILPHDANPSRMELSERTGIISGTEMPVRNKVPFHEYNEDDEYEDENLFEKIDTLSDSLRDSEARFVDSVHRFLRDRGFITDNQRNALKNILFKLEDR